MKRRTRQQVGELLSGRRLFLGLRQEELEGVSSSTVRIWEKGGDRAATRSLTAAAYMRALEWPPDAIDRLLVGEDPADFDPTPTEPAPAFAMAALDGTLFEDLDEEDRATLLRIAQGMRATKRERN